jgi:Cellulose synthase subunit D
MAMDRKTQPLIEHSDADLQLYYAQKHCNAQWRTFLTAISSEIFHHAQGDDAELFFREVGRGMAELMRLHQVEGLRQLQQAMNDRLEQMDWGWVELGDAGQAINVCHYAAPSAIADDTRGMWARSLGHTLEGLYGQWFLAQGAAVHLRTKLVSNPSPGEFLLRHSR